MSWARRAGLAGAALAALYLGFLLVGGTLVRGCVEARVERRLARALGAEVEIGSTSVNVWRGTLVFEDVHAARRDGGLVELDIARIDAELAGWGAMLLDREVDRCVVRGLALRLSARGLAEVASRERQPLRVASLELEAATIAVMPTAILPGLGRLDVAIDHARARGVELSHGLSWLSGLRELDAHVVAPAGVEVGVGFAQGELALSAAWLGSSPVRVPFKMPTVDPDAYEVDHLIAIAREVLRSAGKVLLERSVRERVIEGVFDALD